MTNVNIKLTDGHILVGNSSNVAADVAMSGDVTIDDTGATTIKNNVALGGSPTTTTQSPGDNSTKIATTAYVDNAVSGGGSAPTFQYLTSGSGATYTTPSGCTALLVKMVAGGGGGGGDGTSPTDGGDGGDTIFNSVHAAGGTGGGAGTSSNSSGNGGAGGTGGSGSASLRIAGAGGGNYGTAGSKMAGGIGGSSPFGGAGAQSHATNPGGSASANSGSGGAGAPINSVYYPGGGGGAGEYVELYISSPGASYTYTVGAGGSGGTGGSYSGGDGGSGLIIVTEYY
jgi:hypothetical protein